MQTTPGPEWDHILSELVDLILKYEDAVTTEKLEAARNYSDFIKIALQQCLDNNVLLKGLDQRLAEARGSRRTAGSSAGTQTKDQLEVERKTLAALVDKMKASFTPASSAELLGGDAMVSRQEVTLALRRNLMKGHIEPMFGVEDTTDINNDLHRFLLQERILARLGKHWPSVLVSPANDDWAALSPERAVPIDFQALADLRLNADLNLGAIDDEIRHEFWQAQQQGLPVWTTPLPTARRSFFEKLGDFIYSRAHWLGRAAAATATTPKVTATSTPANQQARWTKGHFFSIHTVFGNTAHSQNVNAGIYCFWLAKDTPTPLLPVYDIQQDTSVPL